MLNETYAHRIQNTQMHIQNAEWKTYAQIQNTQMHIHDAEWNNYAQNSKDADVYA